MIYFFTCNDIFGLYHSDWGVDAWWYAPRFYGTGESYVFQVLVCVCGGGKGGYFVENVPVHDSLVLCNHRDQKVARQILASL
jgi:hypothetical protein